MRSHLSLTVIAATIVTAGCTGMAEKRRQLEANLPEAERAYMIGKFSVPCKPDRSHSKCRHRFNSLSVYYRYPQNEAYNSRLNFTTGSMFGSDTDPDYVSYDKKEKGFYFCRILPEGDYSLYSIGFWNFAGGGSGYYLEEENYFDVPFHLEAGKIASIGHVKLTTSVGRNIFGIPLSAPGVLMLSPLAGEDIQPALEKCPEHVRGNNIIEQEPWKSVPGDTPLVIVGPGED